MEGGTGGRTPRRVVASYRSYGEARWAVDHLSDEGFPVGRISIVVADPRLVERVTGRAGYGTAALDGAASGAAAGVLFGLAFGILSIIDPQVEGLVLAFWSLLSGLAIGPVVGLSSYALSGSRWDFSSVGQMKTGNYNVVTADDVVAEEVREVLKGLRGNTVGSRGLAE